MKLFSRFFKRFKSPVNHSNDIKALYQKFPALKGLVRTSYRFGVFRGLMELSVAGKLYMNLPDVGVLSMLTNFAFNVPGDYLGEVFGTKYVNEKINVISPRESVASLKEKYCGFLKAPEVEAWVDFEDYLRKEYFKTQPEFEQRYLKNVPSISGIITGKPEQEAVKDIGHLLFGEKSAVLQKDATLMDLISGLKTIQTEPVDQSLRKFYGQISAIPFNIPNSQRLWERGHYVDLVKNFCSVLKNGYYDETEEEMEIIREAEDTIKDIKSGKKLTREDYSDLDWMAREYLAFLVTTQEHFHEGEENLNKMGGILGAIQKGQKIEDSSKKFLADFIEGYRHFLRKTKDYCSGDDVGCNQTKAELAESFIAECVEGKTRPPDETIKQFEMYIATERKTDAEMNIKTLEKQIASVKDMLKVIQSKEVNQKTLGLDELLAYTESREIAMKKAGVSEKRVYCSLAEARKRFIEKPVSDFTRDMTKEEITSVVNTCFKEAERTTKCEVVSHVSLFALFGLSLYSPVLFQNQLVNALSWGMPIGARSWMESYYTTKGGRVMTAAMTHIFFKSFQKEGINAESSFSEFESTMMQAYNRGYFVAMGGALVPAYGSKTINNPWLFAVPIAAAGVFFGLAYHSWFKSVKNLKTQIYENAIKN